MQANKNSLRAADQNNNQNTDLKSGSKAGTFGFPLLLPEVAVIAVPNYVELRQFIGLLQAARAGCRELLSPDRQL